VAPEEVAPEEVVPDMAPEEVAPEEVVPDMAPEEALEEAAPGMGLERAGSGMAPEEVLEEAGRRILRTPRVPELVLAQRNPEPRAAVGEAEVAQWSCAQSRAVEWLRRWIARCATHRANSASDQSGGSGCRARDELTPTPPTLDRRSTSFTAARDTDDA